ncbi:MAG: hypothetical protein IJT32_04390 [Lachnospiraceae bacterium]|nr:hypothetical protein [Lachnospiraceae bacterium]
MHTPFPIFTIFFFFCLFVFFRIRHLQSRREERDAAFWAREEAAMHAPNADLSKVPFLQIPLERFPMGLLQTDEAGLIEEELRTLAAKPILNLSGMTNTDIRLAYGADNFDYMQNVGENFDRLEVLLCDFAKLLIENGHSIEAIPVLEYAVENNATISSIYTLLGECYDDAGDGDALNALIATVEGRDMMMQASILDHLRGLIV